MFSYLIENAVKQYGGVNIAPISVDYSFLRQDKPEVIIEIGKVQTFYEFKQDRKEFCANLSMEDIYAIMAGTFGKDE